MSGPVIDGFISLAPHISFFQASASAPPTSKTGPQLVILCSWGWAKRKYIAKYTDGYQRLFPSASILLIESDVADFVWRSRSVQQERTGSAIDVIMAAVKAHRIEEGGSKEAPILLVAMSDGGVNSTVNLAHALQQSHSLSALPIRALVIDSAPMVSDWQRGYNAFSTSISKAVLPVRILGSVAILLALLSMHLFGGGSPFEVNRQALNDGTTVDKSCRRVYIYSKGDELTDWQIVHSHAAEAKQMGYPVREELFSNSQHCAHIMEDSERYWNAVKQEWQTVDS